MALVSPGVEVDVIDQSQYLPAAQNSVPLVVVATAANKADPTTPGAVAQATTAANAGQLYLVTSQSDLVSLYGTPFFYTTTNGTPINGYELNEYGLLAAYSTLGVTNQAYILRADIDLASLVGQTSRPVGTPADGTVWLNSSTTTWGIYQFNQTTGTFTNQVPWVLTDASSLSDGYPLQSIGNIGDYAVDATVGDTETNPVTGNSTYFYKTPNNLWVELGGDAWLDSWPTVQGTQSNPTVVAGDTITFNYYSGAPNSSSVDFVLTVPNSPNNTLAGLISAFNAIGFADLTAANVSGKFTIYVSGSYPNASLGINSYTGTTFTALGLTLGTYIQPQFVYATAAQMPLWTAGQATPAPTGSVWLKVGSAGTGLAPVLSQYSAATATWSNLSVPLYTSDWAAITDIDATGGQAIPSGSVYCQYNYDAINSDPTAPLYFFQRIASGPTIVTGTVASPVFSGSYQLNVQVSQPGTSALITIPTINITSPASVNDIVVAWSGANIPYTSASVATTGALTLTHTQGGVIIINDISSSTSTSTGLLEVLGFEPNVTSGVNFGPGVQANFHGVASTAVTGIGTNATFNITNKTTVYSISTTIANGGNGYAVGDKVKILGSNLGGFTPANDLEVTVLTVNSGAITAVAYTSGFGVNNLNAQLTNWYPLDYTPSAIAPSVAPANQTNWFYSVVDQADIMVNFNGQWYGYQNRGYDQNGFPTSATNYTDPNGPICQATQPTTQSTGAALVNGDLWIDTSNLEDYPQIYRYTNANTQNAAFVLIDNTDHVNSQGVLFADARWAGNGDTSPYADPIPTIVSLLTSNYLDLDAPQAALYPSGTLLWNTRLSGYNVKQYMTNYFNAVSFPDEELPEVTDAWVTVSGNQTNGAPYMGRNAQRIMVVNALNAIIETNTDIRDEDNDFNLIATPNYPECQATMIALNDDRGDTGYIVGDTPMRLPANATAIQAWATNAADAPETDDEGLVTVNTYLGLFYPSGLTSDLSGNQVVVPSSHMMLRTIIRNDEIAYPWFAPAGTRRGIIDNASSIGYLDAQSGNYVPIKTNQGLRDVLYENNINPMVYFTGNGLLNYGNKTSFESDSALDRINVARLIAYIRRQLTLAARPFVFEPNDAVTRKQIQGVIQTLMVDLVAKRGIYDYLVVCDESNNTPARIDRNELWVDVAIEPTIAAEFIYIPVRVLNTGGIAALSGV